ncbi:hypothetical protein [Variovorax sp. GB1P17]|uniref:hypothetical protein n=1 Tax=Variovorax sp. GB1P17 TaxID=3443740 RepID=UPI003F44EDD5
MATYEQVIRETDRIEVIDAFDHRNTVIECRAYFERVSITKHYQPVCRQVSYRLADGRPVRRTHKAYFDTEDGRDRFFVA